MTQTANRPRRLTPATAMIDVRSALTYQLSELTQQGRARDAYELLGAALAAEELRERLDAMEQRERRRGH